MPNDNQSNPQTDTSAFTYDSTNSTQFQAGNMNGTYTADYQNEKDTNVNLWHHHLENIQESHAHAAFTDIHNYNVTGGSKEETIIDGNHNHPPNHLDHLHAVEHPGPATAPVEFHPTINVQPEHHLAEHHVEHHSPVHHDPFASAHNGGHESNHSHSAHDHSHHGGDPGHHGGSDSVH